MNQLSIEMRVRLAQLLCENVGVRGTSRILDISPNTVLRYVRILGDTCAKLHDDLVRGLTCMSIQCDELTSIIGGRRRDIGDYGKRAGWGERYTWTGLDADSKLVICWHPGGRTRHDAMQFLQDLRERVPDGCSIATDAYAAYAPGIAECFGLKAHHETYLPRRLWSGTKQKTAFVERMNLTIRQGNRRFSRRTNAISRKPENHDCMLALFLFFYNFIRIHKSLRVTPAMEAGVTNYVWTLEDLVWCADSHQACKPLMDVDCYPSTQRMSASNACTHLEA